MRVQEMIKWNILSRNSLFIQLQENKFISDEKIYKPGVFCIIRFSTILRAEPDSKSVNALFKFVVEFYNIIYVLYTALSLLFADYKWEY